jgi:prepilin-type N-terminal cleavage/methylation domain-containing protein
MDIKQTKNRAGFTLIELSIVLVIIGLLIGGILVAQSMIKSAKINAQIRQLQQFDIAVLNFQNKYNSFPGDSTYFPTAGNGNGYFEDTTFATDTYGSISKLDDEEANFWRHLTQSGDLQSDVVYSNSTGSGIVPGTHIPKSAFDSKYGVGIWGMRINVGGGSKISSFYLIGGFSTTDDSFGGNMTSPFGPTPIGVFTPSEALAIDGKIDDGNAYFGAVFVDPFFSQYSSDYVSCTNNYTDYLVSNTGNNCYLNIRIGMSTLHEKSNSVQPNWHP